MNLHEIFDARNLCKSLVPVSVPKILERASQGSVSKQLLRSGVIILYCYLVCPVMAEVISKLAVRRGLKAAEPSTVRHFVFFLSQNDVFGWIQRQKVGVGQKSAFRKARDYGPGYGGIRTKAPRTKSPRTESPRTKAHEDISPQV